MKKLFIFFQIESNISSNKQMKSNTIKVYPEIGKIYQHYKGGKYKVLTMATHSETDEPLVIYQSILFGSIHARPLSMWFDVITLSKDNESLKAVDRFKEIKSE